MVLSQQDIMDQLGRLKARDTGFMKPQEYQNFMPKAIPNVNQGPDRTVLNAQMDSIMGQSNSASQNVDAITRNQQDYEQLRNAQRSLNSAKGSLAQAGGITPFTVQGKGGFNNLTTLSAGIYKNAGNPSGRPVTGIGRAGHYSPITGIGIGRGKWVDYNGVKPGGRVQVNASAAPRFVGFLRALAKTGYKINSLSGLNVRPIAGTNTYSLHSYGLAIDINPSQNPVTYGRPVSNLPRGIGRLAAKYGLVWGGDWHGSKKDTMHFSIPYRKTK